MNSSFLTSDNITYLINNVRAQVKNEIDYDITNEKKYINILKKLVKTIHSANMSAPKPTDYMNHLVITKCVPFLVNQINKTRNQWQQQGQKKSNGLYGNLPIVTSNRPETTRSTDYSKPQDFSSLKPSQGQNQGAMDFSSLQLSDQGQLGNNPHAAFSNNSNRPMAMPGNDQNNLYKQPPMSNQGGGLEPPPREMPRLTQMGDEPNKNNLKMDISNFNNQQSRTQPQPLNNDNDFSALSLNSEPTPIDNVSGVNTKDLDEKIDFAKRLEEMQRERDYSGTEQAKSTDAFDNRTINIESRQQEFLQNKADKASLEEQTFFNKLAENNKGESKATQERDADIQAMNLQKLSNNYMDSGFEMDDNSYMNYSKNSLQLGSTNASVAADSLDDFSRKLPDTNRSVEDEDTYTRDVIEQNKDSTKEHIDNTFLSTNYKFERRKRRILTIDISSNLPDFGDGRKAVDNISNSYWGKFRVNLAEEFVVDKLSDVFIESIIINNPAQATSTSNLYFIMDIEEFNIKTISNNNFMMDKFVMPNENTASSGTSKMMKYHLKSNYVATVNPTKLNSLTFNITNEDDQNVNLALTDSTATVNFATGYKAGVESVVVNDGTKFTLFDAIYNSNNRFVGIITAISVNTLSFNNLTSIPLRHGEKLFIVDSSIRTGIFSEDVSDLGDTTIAVDNGTDDTDSSAETDFAVGDKVYLGNGSLLGKLSAITARQLTFESGISVAVPNNVRMYKESALPRVFASNTKSNRIILELVFMPR